jgi:hypothetical protein
MSQDCGWQPYQAGQIGVKRVIGGKVAPSSICVILTVLRVCFAELAQGLTQPCGVADKLHTGMPWQKIASVGHSSSDNAAHSWYDSWNCVNYTE